MSSVLTGRSEAKKILSTQSDLDESEKQYLLEYYSLVRENKTNYVSTLAFHRITGHKPQEATDFFKVYHAEFTPSKRYGLSSVANIQTKDE
jgi:hypothetical protein